MSWTPPSPLTTGQLVTAAIWNVVVNAILWLYAQLVPSGTIVMTGRASAPSGWLFCDGSAVSRATYADLFTAIGTTYGAGDGSTTFNLPNLKQRFPLGKADSGTGATLGATGGAVDHVHTGPSHTHTYTEVPNHTHPVNVTDPGHAHTQASHSHTVSITDPGHTHNQFGDNVEVQAGSGEFAVRSSGATPTSSSTTGVSASTNSQTPTVNSNTTGISATTSNPSGGVASGTTGAGGTGNTGAANPPFVVVNYMIRH